MKVSARKQVKEKGIKLRERHKKTVAKHKREIKAKAAEKGRKLLLVKQKALEKKGKAAQAAAAKAERHGKRVAAALKAKNMRELRKDSTEP